MIAFRSYHCHHMIQICTLLFDCMFSFELLCLAVNGMESLPKTHLSKWLCGFQ